MKAAIEDAQKKAEAFYKLAGWTSGAKAKFFLDDASEDYQKLGNIKEDGGYKNRPLEAHSKSYFRTDLWGNYDVTGVKGGQAIIKLDTSTRRYFKSPTKW